MRATYLGIDASTQSVTAILIEVVDGRARTLAERSFTYDQALPEYHTSHGAIRAADPTVVVAPPAMWADALDRMFGRLAAEFPDALSRLAAVSGSAQQHGTVYLNGDADARIAHLDPAQPLAQQLDGVFSRAMSPIWMDSSTTEECREISQAVGGDVILASRTGSRAFERFAGPQIRRFFKQYPDAYRATTRIHLISSFLATLLAGQDAPVDPGDGSGMSLMDLVSTSWWPPALAATALDLHAKLPRVAASSAVVGTLAPYWQRRYHLPAARVVAWSGDNTCSLIGSGLVHEGRLAISMGTSDTIFGLMHEPRVSPTGTGHVFGAPTGDYMGITVFKNGSLARERVRDQYGLDWTAFSAALRSTPPGNNGALMLPWFDPEITPLVLRPAVHRRGLDERDAARNVRAVVEGQMMAMANHSRWMGVEITAIHATGGAAANRDMLRVMADVFNADVFQLSAGNSACLGAALRAWHADALAGGHPRSWAEIVQDVAAPRAESRVAPIAANAAVYKTKREDYAAFEASALSNP